MPSEAQKQTYEAIMKMYDHAESAVDLVEEFAEISEPLIPDVEGIVQTVEKNCEFLLDKLESYMKEGRILSGVDKMKMLKAKKEIDEAFGVFFTKINNKGN